MCYIEPNIPQGNNTLMLLGCDIVKKWSSGESKAPEDLNVLVSLWGSSKKALEDRLPEKAKDGLPRFRALRIKRIGLQVYGVLQVYFG